jgi:ribosomal protein L23
VEKLFSVKVLSVNTFLTARGKKHALVKLHKDSKADDVAIKLKMIA